MNQRRELLSDLLEEIMRSDDSKNWHCDIDITQTLQDSPADVKRLVTPILHYSITMNVLIGFLEKAFRYCI